MSSPTRRGWPLLAVAGIAGAVLIAPYVVPDIDASRIEVRSTQHWVLLLVHVFTASIALVLGPLQFVPAIRVHRAVHRSVGRAYLLVGVLPAALTAIPVAILSDNWITRIGLLVPAVGWLVTGALGLRAARRRRFAEHRAWMMRNYALTFLAVTSRLVVPLLLLAQFPVIGTLYGGSVQAAVDATIPIGQGLGWIVNLVVVELVLRRETQSATRIARTSASSQPPTPP